MVVGISGLAGAVGTGLSGRASVARDRPGTEEKSEKDLLEALKQAEEERREEWLRKTEETEDLITRLREQRVDFDEERKAAAREKVARIKAELQALRMMANINPEAAARRIAQLSKELAAAVKAYSGSGGGGVVGLGAAAGGMTAASGQAGAAQGTVSPEGAAQAGVVGAADTVNAATMADGVVAGAGAGAASSSGEEATQAVPGTTVGTGAQETGQAGDASASSDGQAEDSQSAADTKAKEDQAFAQEVNRVKAMLKAILQMAKRKLEDEAREGQDSSESLRDVADGERALKDVDQALNGLTMGGAQAVSGAITGMPAGVNIVV